VDTGFAISIRADY